MGTYMRVLLLQYLTFLLLLIIWSYFLPHTYFPRKSSTNQVLDSVFQHSQHPRFSNQVISSVIGIRSLSRFSYNLSARDEPWLRSRYAWESLTQYT